ncbi:hypothetical protein F8S09_04475 [Deinococcus sp. SDU3-2]|uniref:Uncharacterized protein n=1 Tax=Deinococcus terrestris TaxID=2651870 RepID=A0A7X1TR52_9DEIO|nr:hypothetical protein [Deinococcus terrestris]MPY65952.1 hypothetical protein [Deinococcus terrestris]
MLLTLLLWLPALLLLAFGAAGLAALGERSRTGSPSAGWRAATWLVTAAACGPVAWAALDAALGGTGVITNTTPLLLLLALSGALYLPAARRTRRERGGRPTRGVLLWPPAFLLLLLPWAGEVLSVLLGLLPG